MSRTPIGSTPLMHHFTMDNLRACFESLDGKKAVGVDGVTKAMYGQDLEANLQDLHRRLYQMSYRPQPVRRVEIPKEDGSTRPLGISCVEDKIVQEMARRGLGHMKVDTCGKRYLPTLHIAFKANKTRAEVPRSIKDNCCGNMAIRRL